MSSMPASVRITASVGRGCANQRNDVMVIQNLINNRLATGMRALKVDGHCGVLTISAIEEIQRRNLRMNPPDGKIDHNGATLRFLVSGVAGNGAHAHTAAHHKPAGTGGTFPADIIAAAQLSQKNSKIPASVTLAQWALESGWGAKMPAGSNNPFGVKAAAGQPFVESTTREVENGKDVYIKANFRKFASLAEAFDLHGHLIATARPYAHARTLIGDPDKFADALTGVYATDPSYGSLLKSIMKSHNLYQYDK